MVFPAYMKISSCSNGACICAWFCFPTPPCRLAFVLSCILLVAEITTLDALRKMEQLKALIANNNKIAQITGIGGCESINTLVLSHNPITEITGIATLKNITKLSLAHCQIRIIPDLRAHQMLEELRLNDNKINVVPDTIDRNPALKVCPLPSLALDVFFHSADSSLCSPSRPWPFHLGSRPREEPPARHFRYLQDFTVQKAPEPEPPWQYGSILGHFSPENLPFLFLPPIQPPALITLWPLPWLTSATGQSAFGGTGHIQGQGR